MGHGAFSFDSGSGMEEDVTEQIATLMIFRSDREGVNHPRVEEDDKFKDTSIQ